jgi:hypothetical protein
MATAFRRGNAVRIGGSRLRVGALLPLLVLLVALAAGCSGDDDQTNAETTPALPQLTVPGTDRDLEAVEPPPEPEPAPEPEVVPPQAETVPPTTDGGTPAPEPEPPADTPESDVPPPPDSPAERFEAFCNENPGACG